MSYILVGLQWDRHVFDDSLPHPISVASGPAHPRLHPSSRPFLCSGNALHMPLLAGVVPDRRIRDRVATEFAESLSLRITGSHLRSPCWPARAA